MSALTPTSIQPSPLAASGRESWAWMYGFWQVSLDAVSSNPTAFTHISPLWYTLNYDYTGGPPRYYGCDSCASDTTGAAANSFDGMTTQQVTAQLAATNLAVVPGIYAGADNHGEDDGVLNILDNVNGAGDSRRRTCPHRVLNEPHS